MKNGEQTFSFLCRRKSRTNMITKKSIDFLESWSKWGVRKKYYFLRTSFSQRWLFTYYLCLYFINYLSLTQFHYLSLVSISLYHHITVLSLSPNLFSLSLSLFNFWFCLLGLIWWWRWKGLLLWSLLHMLCVRTQEPGWGIRIS